MLTIRRIRHAREFALVAILVGAVPAALSAQELEARGAEANYTYVGADYSYANFQGDIDPWHLAALSLGRVTEAGSFIARVNWAERFGSSGIQAEGDAYPSLGEHTYAYLNTGYSGASIFPQWRFGGEIFRSLPRAWEASLGFRQLRFGGPPVTLFTGSVGKYRGNYWFSLRPYIRDKQNGVSASASLSVRRYYADSDHYIGGRIGYGSAPGEQVTTVELTRLNSATAVIQGSRTLASRVIGSWSLTYEHEEIAVGRFRSRCEVSGGAKLRF